MADPLTTYHLRAVLEDRFPGVRLKETSRLGGVVVSIQVWDFSIEMSLTVEGVSITDTNGEVRFTFSYRPRTVGSTPIVIRQRATSDADELRDMADWTVHYLSGIVAAIEMAFEKPVPRKTSIFDDED